MRTGENGNLKFDLHSIEADHPDLCECGQTKTEKLNRRRWNAERQKLRMVLGDIPYTSGVCSGRKDSPANFFAGEASIWKPDLKRLLSTLR